MIQRELLITFKWTSCSWWWSHHFTGSLLDNLLREFRVRIIAKARNPWSLRWADCYDGTCPHFYRRNSGKTKISGYHTEHWWHRSAVLRTLHTRFRFLNQPASRVSLGMETDRDTLDEILAGPRSSGDDITSPSSWRRSEEEANFLSLDIIGSAGIFLIGAGGARGGLPEWTIWPELS